MNKEQLAKFSNPDRERFSGPFSFGEYSYSTNGHILVRVPRLADVPEWDALNENAAKMFAGLDYEELAARLVAIPELPATETEPCYYCAGSGKVSTCPECDGARYVTLENDFNEYECECLSCYGNGKVSGEDKMCERCNGTGIKAKHDMFIIGNVGFSTHYLRMLKELPGIQIAPTVIDKANYFKWDEGDGLLMPMGDFYNEP